MVTDDGLGYAALEQPARTLHAGLEGYEALDEGCALFDLSARGRLRVTGEDRARFLNNLLTNEVASLKAGYGCRACLLDRQSRTLADVRLFARPNHILLDIEPGQDGATLAQLARCRIADRVEMECVTASTAMISLQGPASLQVLESLVGRIQARVIEALPPYGSMDSGWRGRPIAVLRVPRTGRMGFDLVVPLDLHRPLVQAALSAGAVPCGDDVMETGRIEAGIARFGADFTDENLFLEGAVGDAYSRSKGCFIGQEVVARVMSRGHVNRLRAGLMAQGTLSPGDEVSAVGTVAGRVTSAAYSPRLRATLAFALLKRELAEEAGRSCVVQGRRGAVPAELAHFPFLADLNAT